MSHTKSNHGNPQLRRDIQAKQKEIRRRNAAEIQDSAGVHTDDGVRSSRIPATTPCMSIEEQAEVLAEQQIESQADSIGEVTYPDEDADEEDDVKELNFDEN